MSNITTIYQGIIAACVAQWTTKTRIPNPYSLPDNADNFLRDSWGIKVGPSSPVPFENLSFMTKREITMVFTREMVATDSDTDVPDDIGTRLLEDVYEAQNMFYGVDKMGISQIQNVELGSTSAIAQVRSGKNKFLAIEATFTLDILEYL